MDRYGGVEAAGGGNTRNLPSISPSRDRIWDHGAAAHCCRPERQADARGCPRVPCSARYSATRSQGADFGVRSDDPGMAPVQPDYLHYIPGVGPMLATALVASVADPSTFRSGRNFSAWIGLVLKQHSRGARSGSAASVNRAIAICAACSWPEHSPSSAMPISMAPGIGLGSRRYQAVARPRSLPLRSPTRSRGWHGP